MGGPGKSGAMRNSPRTQGQDKGPEGKNTVGSRFANDEANGGVERGSVA